MTDASIPVRVECYAGHRGEETPRRFYFGDSEIEVAEVIDRWLAPDHRYFKVRDARALLISCAMTSRRIAGS